MRIYARNSGTYSRTIATEPGRAGDAWGQTIAREKLGHLSSGVAAEIRSFPLRFVNGKVLQEGEPPANTLLVVAGLGDHGLLVKVEPIVPLP
jgi:hypothetical protein